MSYKSGYEDQDLYVESGTDRVPDDGLFHIVLHGRIIEVHPSVKRALARVQQLRHDPHAGDDGQPGTDAKSKSLQAEMVHRFLQESSREKRARATRKGGKGGSGGVGG
jgi:hypothetical protein